MDTSFMETLKQHLDNVERQGAGQGWFLGMQVEKEGENIARFSDRDGTQLGKIVLPVTQHHTEQQLVCERSGRTQVREGLPQTVGGIEEHGFSVPMPRNGWMTLQPCRTWTPGKT